MFGMPFLSWIKQLAKQFQSRNGSLQINSTFLSKVFLLFLCTAAHIQEVICSDTELIKEVHMNGQSPTTPTASCVTNFGHLDSYLHPGL